MFRIRRSYAEFLLSARIPHTLLFKRRSSRCFRAPITLKLPSFARLKRNNATFLTQINIKFEDFFRPTRIFLRLGLFKPILKILLLNSYYWFITYRAKAECGLFDRHDFRKGDGMNITKIEDNNLIERIMNWEETDRDDTQKKPFNEVEKTKMENAYLQHKEDYKFYLGFGLQVIGVFYAVLGGILSIYFSNNPNPDKGLIKLFLLLPIFISIILGFLCIFGAIIWTRATAIIYKIAKICEIVIVHKFDILSWLLYIFGGLFIVVAVALAVLMNYLIS